MLLIKNATVYTMEAEGVLQNADILCEDGKIRAIGRNLTAEGAEVIDASGLIATPGLIDAHTHAGGFAGDNQDLNESTNPVTAELDAIHGIDIYADDFQEIHTRGVTACCFIPGSANVICGTGFVAKTAGKSSIQDLAILNPAVMKCAMGGNPKNCYGKQGRAPKTRMAVASIFRETLRKARTYLDKKEAAAGDPEKMPAYDAQCEALIPVLRREIPLKVHSEQFDMLTVINIAKEFGCDYTLTVIQAFWSVRAAGAVSGFIMPTRARPTSAGNAGRRSTGPSLRFIAKTVSICPLLVATPIVVSSRAMPPIERPFRYARYIQRTTSASGS